jgi:hypothetical protein
MVRPSNSPLVLSEGERSEPESKDGTAAGGRRHGGSAAGGWRLATDG